MGCGPQVDGQYTPLPACVKGAESRRVVLGRSGRESGGRTVCVLSCRPKSERQILSAEFNLSGW